MVRVTFKALPNHLSFSYPDYINNLPVGLGVVLSGLLLPPPQQSDFLTWRNITMKKTRRAAAMSNVTGDN